MQEAYLKALDEYFCAHYSNYTKISAIPGYKMPDLIVIGRDGNIGRKDSRLMRLCYQADSETLLAAFKETLSDTDSSFSFRFPRFFERRKKRFQKDTFAKILPDVLKHYDQTPEEAGKYLTIDGKIWTGIVKGKLYPEKNTVLALALCCHMNAEDVSALLVAGEFTFSNENVRDVVVGYLLTQKVFNEKMRDRCLEEYKIDCLPIKRETADQA